MTVRRRRRKEGSRHFARAMYTNNLPRPLPPSPGNMKRKREIQKKRGKETEYVCFGFSAWGMIADERNFDGHVSKDKFQDFLHVIFLNFY